MTMTGPVALLAVLVAQASAPATWPVRTIERGVESGIDSPRHAAARTGAEWTALWKAHHVERPAPPVDFTTEMVIAVFLGTRPSAGYGVEIVSAAERDETVVVTFRETKPAPGAVTAQILTSPYHIAAVPASRAPIVFRKLEG